MSDRMKALLWIPVCQIAFWTLAVLIFIEAAPAVWNYTNANPVAVALLGGLLGLAGVAVGGIVGLVTLDRVLDR